jgi:hypothetical protein
MRHKVWEISKTHPHQAKRWAHDAITTKNYDAFKAAIDEDPPCMRDPWLDEVVSDYVNELDT